MPRPFTGPAAREERPLVHPHPQIRRVTQRTLTHPAALAIVLFVAAFAGVPAASAQQLGLPDQIATSSSLNAEQQAEITKFVEANKTGLAASEPAKIRHARQALLAPLRVPHASVEFRTRYADALEPVLRSLASDAHDEIAINALCIAGELGTKKGGVDLLDRALADKRPSIRMTAVLGYKNVFAAAREQPVLGNAYAGIVDTLGKVLATESDPLVLDGAALSLDAATRVDPAKIEGIQAHAAEVLAKGVGNAVRSTAAGPLLTGAGVQAGKSLFDLLSKPDTTLSQQVLIACGGFAGDVVCSARRRVSAAAAQPLDEAEREQVRLAVVQAERVYSLAHQRLGVGKPVDLYLAEALAASKDDQFKADAGKLIDAGGVLTQPPFGFDAGRWLAKN